jgi:hypothetical protein
MQDHELMVGEELVIQGLVRLTILAVEGDTVVLGITAEPNGVLGPVARQSGAPLSVVPVPVPNDN